jgi:hypothetical protein
MPIDHWPNIVGIIVSVFLTMGAGGLLRRLQWLTAEADASLLKLVIRLLVPCLIFRAVMGNESLRSVENLAIPPVVGFGLCALGVLVGIGVARLGAGITGLSTPVERRTFAVCVGIFNYGFVPIPLVQGLFASATLGVLFVHNVGVDLAIWTVGLLVLTGTLDRRWWRKVINPPSITIVVAVGLNLLGVRPEMLGPVWRTIELLSHAAIPTSLLLIGATIADELASDQDGHTLAQSTKIVSWAVALRLAALPAVFILVAAVLPATDELKRVLVVEAGQPSAVFPIVMARHYGGDPGTAVRVVLGTSLLSLLTMPLWIGGGLTLLW